MLAVSDNVCPHCGQTVPDTTLPAGLKLRGYHLKIFKWVKRAGPNGINSRRLLDLLYQDDPDGGPLHALQSMRVRILMLNAKLLDHGLVIRASKGGPRTPTEYVLKEIGK